MSVSSLDKVLAYVGSTGSTSISFILPGLFYYKISAPDSIHHQRLTKEDDDDEYEESTGQGLLAQGALKTSAWRTVLLRRMALALAMYGFLVMIVCLIMNTFFTVTH
jgi:amino acid permease